MSFVEHVFRRTILVFFVERVFRRTVVFFVEHVFRRTPCVFRRTTFFEKHILRKNKNARKNDKTKLCYEKYWYSKDKRLDILPLIKSIS